MAGREKTYYFLKLEKDFFSKKEIKLLRKIAGGDTYTIIYLKMLLMALADEGVFYFEELGDSIAEEVALAIEEDTENVAVTLAFLQKKGLVEIIEADKYYLTSTPEMVGKITSNALRQRRFQAKKKKQALENNATITQYNVEIEKEIDIKKDINIDIQLEEEIDINETPTANYLEYYQNRIGVLDGYQVQKLNDYHAIDGLEGDLIKRAIDRAADNSKRNFGYINSILKNWAQSGIKTIVQQDEEQRNFEDRKASRNNPNPKPSNVPSWSNPDYKPAMKGMTREEFLADEE